MHRHVPPAYWICSDTGAYHMHVPSTPGQRNIWLIKLSPSKEVDVKSSVVAWRPPRALISGWFLKGAAPLYFAKNSFDVVEEI